MSGQTMRRIDRERAANRCRSLVTQFREFMRRFKLRRRIHEQAARFAGRPALACPAARAVLADIWSQRRRRGEVPQAGERQPRPQGNRRVSKLARKMMPHAWTVEQRRKLT